MCAIIGALVINNEWKAAAIIQEIWRKSHERGRDGRGYRVRYELNPYLMDPPIVEVKDTSRQNVSDLDLGGRPVRSFLANLRAEPTTEYVADKRDEDQQPYTAGKWTIVHNGTIANDKELRSGLVPTNIDSAAVAEHLDRRCTQEPATRSIASAFTDAMRALKGSFAIIAQHEGSPNTLFAAVNYRPLWYVEVPGCGVFLASARDYLPKEYAPRMLPPYSVARFAYVGDSLRVQIGPLLATQPNRKALVVCSGGLDSVVAATFVQKRMGMDVTLLHFTYGSRAQKPEIKAIVEVAEALEVPIIEQKIDVYRPEDSPLLRADSTIAGGEAGAEFAHEWVPARNLLMLSMATAIAEARGFETLVLGNNLEEAGAYPDNEPEFIARFNDLLPFAIGDGKRLQVIMPVGNLMKHEIVALGHALGAPLHLTWSCYRAGQLHCGTCGPCFMRRTAFAINNLEEVIKYEV
jgi:7-cyano-7-deazaguanine synthase